MIWRGVVWNQPKLWASASPHLIEARTERIVIEVRIAQRRLRLRVAEKATDHWQRHAARNEQRGEGVPKIVDAGIAELRLLAHALPEILDVGQRIAFDV